MTKGFAVEYIYKSPSDTPGFMVNLIRKRAKERERETKEKVKANNTLIIYEICLIPRFAS